MKPLKGTVKKTLKVLYKTDVKYKVKSEYE